ncbi:MAG: S-layer homology domain-containing protein [Peptostreptococcaceae bacterium]
MTKRIKNLALLMIFCNISNALAITDLGNHWAKSEIEKFIENGYINGYEDETFRPNNSITRAEFVKIFNNYLGLTKKSDVVFEDTKNHWAKDEIDIAVTNGIANGISKDEFQPNSPITREQASVMICNYFALKDNNHNNLIKFTDNKTISSWAIDSVEGVIENGYMNGYEDDTFKPKANITRAEAVVTLSRIDILENSIKLSSANKDTRESKDSSTSRWGDVSEQSIFLDEENYYILDATDKVRITKVDKGSIRITEEFSLEKELSKFGGFYAGNENYFMVFGENNLEEIDNKEVIRVVKYDKKFRKVDSISIFSGESNTIEPFVNGTLSISEKENELIIHTSRKRYKSIDGLNHQSQLTIVLDTENMTLKNDLGGFQINYVTHSLNQFAKYDGENAVLIDHGNAYPRSILLTMFNRDMNTVKKVNLLDIPGRLGTYSTGVTVGGFEISDDSYIVAINKVNFDKVESFNATEMVGLEKDERDIIILVYDKDEDEVYTKKLTDYVDNNILASTPRLVKIDNENFVVMWQEFDYGNILNRNTGVKYMLLDKYGNPNSDINFQKGVNLSNEVQPIFDNNEIVWFVDKDNSTYIQKIKF